MRRWHFNSLISPLKEFHCRILQLGGFWCLISCDKEVHKQFIIINIFVFINFQPEKWTFLSKTLDFFKKAEDTSYHIVHRSIVCDYCCQMNEDRLVQVKIFNLKEEGVSLMLRVRNRNEESDHIFENVPYLRLISFNVW